MRFHSDGCERASDVYGPMTAAFRHRADAARAAREIRAEMGYAVTARLAGRYWYVKAHRTTCRCGDCPILHDNGMVIGSLARLKK